MQIINTICLNLTQLMSINIESYINYIDLDILYWEFVLHHYNRHLYNINILMKKNDSLLK